MSHKAQIEFCWKVKKMFPNYFKRCDVIDVGSQYINGSNKSLFYKCNYVGIDLAKGENVHVVGRAHEVMESIKPVISNGVCWSVENKRIQDDDLFDTIVSTECLEHDSYFTKTLCAMYDKLKPGGLLLITCGGDGRQEHGTHRDRPQLSPHTNDYYANLSNRTFGGVLPPGLFTIYHLQQVDNDLQFYGIKK